MPVTNKMLLHYVACITDVVLVHYVVRFLLVLILESVWAMPILTINPHIFMIVLMNFIH